MELRLWEFEADDPSIDSFLEGMSIAHNEAKRSEDWFHWKFEQSPYGKAIMACAFDGKRVAGCVAFGRGIVRYKEKDWNCALSYETFVHPDYQGHGLFKKLILLAEQEMKTADIQFLYNFPNGNSITGFKHMNWICRNDICLFKIKICHPLRVFCNINSLRQPFKPAPSNLDLIKNMHLPDLQIFKCSKDKDVVEPIWTKQYIKWRFFTFPNREYCICDNDEIFFVSMIGSRGKLKCAHILYAIAKDGRDTEFIMRSVLKAIVQQVNPDVISYSSTVMDTSLSKVFGFFRVPDRGNFCYKVLDDKMIIDDFKILLPPINAHTY